MLTFAPLLNTLHTYTALCRTPASLSAAYDTRIDQLVVLQPIAMQLTPRIYGKDKKVPINGV
jgi:hypothetical protein